LGKELLLSLRDDEEVLSRRLADDGADSAAKISSKSALPHAMESSFLFISTAEMPLVPFVFWVAAGTIGFLLQDLFMVKAK
jgi:hypothetical protein